MSNWRKRLNRFQLFAVLILGFAPLARAAQHINDCEDYYTIAIRLMRAFYPELLGQGATVQFGGFAPLEADGPLRTLTIGLSEVRPTEPVTAAPYPQRLSSAERLGHLSTRFEFDWRDNKILLMFASGSFVNDERYMALTKVVSEHQDWNETQITEALMAAGAKFGPSQKKGILARFPAGQLSPILGKIEIQSVQFDFRANNEPPLGATLKWTIFFRASKAGKTDKYFVSMEPFDAKIVSLGRQAPD